MDGALQDTVFVDLFLHGKELVYSVLIHFMLHYV